MPSPFLPPLVTLVAGLLLGALVAWLAGRAAQQRAASERNQQAAEHAAGGQELAGLRAEHASLSRERDLLRDERE